MIEVRLLGPVDARDDGRALDLGAPKARAVLALLALNHGRTIAAPRLVEDLWGDRPPASAAKALQVYVSQLRKALGQGAIATEVHGYRLASTASTVDVADFEARVAAGRSALAAGHADVAASALADGLALWRGDALEDLRDEPGLAPARAHFDELRLVVEELHGDALLASGRDEALLPSLARLAREHPLRERFQEQLMLALYRAGRQADALAVYAELRRRLHDELGLEPSPRTRGLQQAILRHEPSLGATPAASTPPVIAAGSVPARLRLVAEPLARGSGAELVVLSTVAEAAELA